MASLPCGTVTVPHVLTPARERVGFAPLTLQMAEALANGVIKDCVITVPSYYSQDEKQAT